MSKDKVYLKDINDAYIQAKKVLANWEASDGPNGSFEGQTVKVVSKELHIRFKRLIDSSADAGKTVDAQAYKAIMALDDFATKYAKWCRAAAVMAASPRGTPDVWESWKRVDEALTPIVDQKPHTVKYLVEVANAPRDQIARIYGWTDADGNPQLDKVQEELETPGTHYDPKSWVSPAMTKHFDAVALRWEARVTKRSPIWGEDSEEANKFAGKAPEVPSLETLLEHDAPVAQILRLHGKSEGQPNGLTEEEVYELKRDHMEKVGLEAAERAKGLAIPESVTAS